LDGNKTVGSLTFNNSNASYTVAQGGAGDTLTFDNSTSQAVLNTVNGSHVISAPVTLNSNLAVTVSNAADTLTMSGQVNGASALIKSGSGTLVLSASNSYSGGTTLNGG